MTATSDVITRLSALAGQELKNLLEDRHLYQFVRIAANEILKEAIDAERQGNLKNYLYNWFQKEVQDIPFTLARQQLFVLNRSSARHEPSLTLLLQNVGLFCRNCKRKEAFAPVWFVDGANEIRKMMTTGTIGQIALPSTSQVFFLTYQCQRCLGKPESFLVSREKWTLGLHGRSPIELVEMPAYIPTLESHFYRDAVIAYNSGKLLAAIFYLRTFIEQFARRMTGLTGRVSGDEILDEYYKGLPSPTKDQMPSLREWYDKLSEALHSAKAEDEMFESGKKDIEHHFEIRKIFRVPEAKERSVHTAEPPKHDPPDPSEPDPHNGP